MEVELTNKEKYRVIQHEFEKFFKAECELIPYNKDLETLILHDIVEDLSDEEYKTLINSETSNEVKKVILNVLLASQVLSREERLIVKYEFLNRKDPCWWLEYFSRSQYYRKRKETIDKIYRLLF